MPECTEQLKFTIPIIRYTMDSDDRPTEVEKHQLTKKMSLLPPVKIEVPDNVRSGRRSSEPNRYYIPPQCNNRLSPRSARKRDSRKNSKSNHKDESLAKDRFGHKPCNCEDCRSSSPLPPGYGPQTLCPGYDQMKMSLLEVPWNEDYTEASSDDLSSEWDSDVPESTPKVIIIVIYFTCMCSLLTHVVQYNEPNYILLIYVFCSLYIKFTLLVLFLNYQS